MFIKLFSQSSTRTSSLTISALSHGTSQRVVSALPFLPSLPGKVTCLFIVRFLSLR